MYLYEYLFLRKRRLLSIYFCNYYNVIIPVFIFMYLKQIKELFLIPKFWRIFLIGLQTLSILKHLRLQTPRVNLERKHFSLSAWPTHQFNAFYTLRLRYFLSWWKSLLSTYSVILFFSFFLQIFRIAIPLYVFNPSIHGYLKRTIWNFQLFLSWSFSLILLASARR